jgi:hypothetical protein
MLAEGRLCELKNFVCKLKEKNKKSDIYVMNALRYD